MGLERKDSQWMQFTKGETDPWWVSQKSERYFIVDWTAVWKTINQNLLKDLSDTDIHSGHINSMGINSHLSIDIPFHCLKFVKLIFKFVRLSCQSEIVEHMYVSHVNFTQVVSSI